MKALMLSEPRKFEAVDLPVPQAGDGEVLVEIGAVAICGSDILGYSGQHPRIGPPTILGHELAGTIVAVGPAVEGVALGDRVCIDPTFGCGACRLCAAGRHNICAEYEVLGERADRPGGMAGMLCVPADHVHPIPDELSLREAAVVQPLSVSYHAVAHRGRPAPDEVVAIAGAGPIGLGILLAARESSAKTIVSDPLAHRRDLAAEFGADVVIDPTVDDLESVVRDETDGYGADVSFEAVGGQHDEVLLSLAAATASGGRLVIVGLKSPTAPLPIQDLKFNEKTVIGSAAHPDSFPAVIRRVASGAYPAARMISHVFSFDQAAEAFDLLEARSEPLSKVVLEPRQSADA